MNSHLDKDAGTPVDVEHAAASGLLATALEAAVAAAGRALEQDDPVRAVHDLRKAFKQLRGDLRLVRGSGRGAARALRDELGAAARKLSQARDTAVQRETLDKLVEKGLLTPAARRSAREALAGGGETGGETFPLAVRAEITALVARCGPAVVEMAGTPGPKAVIGAIVADYARARERGRSVDTTDDEELHELRKAVIAHRYQMELLTPYWPALGELWEKELQRLRDKLGEHHDLAVLAASVRDTGTGGWRGEVLKAVEHRQKKLLNRIQRLQAQLFAERPKAFARRLRAYVKAR